MNRKGYARDYAKASRRAQLDNTDSMRKAKPYKRSKSDRDWKKVGA